MLQEHIHVQQWVELFRAIGLKEADMHRWHQEFEQRYPEGHRAFLEWLGFRPSASGRFGVGGSGASVSYCLDLRLSPEAHQDFLESLGTNDAEVARIRRLSKGVRTSHERAGGVLEPASRRRAAKR